MREANVIKYYVLCNRLKNVIRKGWLDWKVDRERIESVAEHVYGVQQLAIAMYSEFNYNIDIYKVIMMLAVHELEEIIIGDLTCFDISSEEKEKIGHNAVEEILSNLASKDEIKSIILEFDERKTKEAIFAYHCDKLECDLQCKIYDEEHCVDMKKQDTNKTYYDERVQELINNGETTWSNMWLEYDRNIYIEDKNFINVLDYIKNNSITKK